MKELSKEQFKDLCHRINEIEVYGTHQEGQVKVREYYNLISLYKRQGYIVKGFDNLYNWSGKKIK